MTVEAGSEYRPTSAFAPFSGCKNFEASLPALDYVLFEFTVSPIIASAVERKAPLDNYPSITGAAVMKVFFDESGQTGTQLLDPDQPHFTLGSTNIPEDHAAKIIQECFPGFVGKELKARSIFRRQNGRRKFLGFAKEVAANSSRFCGAKIDKRFSVVCKIVDNLVEPILHDAGYDFYADNYAARFANMAYFAFSEIMDRTMADSLIESYNSFARKPTTEALSTLQQIFEMASRSPADGSEQFLSLMAAGAAHFEVFHDLSDFNDTNELHVTAVLQCMGFWQEQHNGAFDVIHDESTHFFKRSSSWQIMTNPSASPTRMHVGEKTLQLPIKVHSTTPSKSHECPSLQLCDLIAGFISYSSSPTLTDEDKNFVGEAIDHGMGSLSIFPVEPGTEFVNGPPQVLSGLDVIDQIISAVRNKEH